MSTVLGADQGEGEEGQPWDRLGIQLEKNRSRPWVCLRFGGHDFSAHQEVDLLSPVDMLSKEHPKQRGPRERLGKKALHRPITAARARPAGEAHMVTRPVMTSIAATIQLHCRRVVLGTAE